MSEKEEAERCLREMEIDAQIHAQRGDNSKMIALLRKLDRQEEIPDLGFIADLLAEKPKKTAGRPADEKILAGVKMHLAGLTVHDIMTKRGLTVELALEEASRVLPMSVSSIKGHYRRCLEAGVVPKVKKVTQKKQGN